MKGKKGTLIIRYILIFALLAVFIFPFYWMLLTSLRPPAEWFGAKSFLPESITFENYIILFAPEAAYQTFTRATRSVVGPLLNSLIIAVGGTLLSLLAGVPAAYSMSRYKTGGTFLPFFILTLRMLPPVAAVIPVIVFFSLLRLIDTHIGMMLIYSVLIGLPFTIWLMKSFFDDISVEIDEAARMDGCSIFVTFTRVILPLVKPLLAATALFVFILCWGDFAIAIILTEFKATTLPVQMQMYNNAYGELYGPIAALGIIAVIPVMILTFALQKYLVRGFTFGVMRGG